MKTIEYSKHDARKIIQARLNALPDDEYAAAAVIVSKNVAAWLADVQASRTIKNVLLYKAKSQWREVDVSCLEHEFPDSTFEYVPGKADSPLPSKKYDAIIIPLYGFNDEKYRLGHGSGWYDTFLGTQPQALKIGVGFRANHISFHHEAHDIPLDHIITELDS